MSKESMNVAVFGAGPAGISAARSLAEQGNTVTWIMPEKYVTPRSIYTTTIDHPPLDPLIDPAIKTYLPFIRLLTNHGADLRVPVEPDKYFMVQNQPFIHSLVSQTTKDMPNIHIEQLPQGVLNKAYAYETLHNGVITHIDGQRTVYDAVVDATGVQAHIAAQIEPKRRDENVMVEYVYGARYRGTIEKPEMMLISGPGAGTSWASPSADDPNSFDVVYSAWGPSREYHTRFIPHAQQYLQTVVDFLKTVKGIQFDSFHKEEVYAGMIRAQHTPPPQSKHVYAIGEAAGMARPGSGQSFDRAFRSGDLVARMISENKDPAEFYTAWRKIWNDSVFLAGVFARLPFQMKGEIGTTFDRLHLMSENGKAQQIAKVAGDWIVSGNMSMELLRAIASDYKILSSFLITLIKHAEIQWKGLENMPIEWSLPPAE
jgi:flavin-dependent dehydrogenase